MQVSPSGMASASQADFGGSDSRHLLQTKKRLGALFCLEFIEYGSRGEARQLCCRRSEVSTDDKTAVIRCFPCASAQGATPVTCSRQKSALGRFFVWNLSNTGVGGGKATLLPQVGGLHRRQNSGHPLFSVRVRSRRDSRHLLQTKKRLSGAPPLY